MELGIRLVIFDRDDTLIENKSGHLFKEADLTWIPGALNLLKEIKLKGMKIAVVTNQAGVAKGLYRERDVIHFHNVMNSSRYANGAIDLFIYCPHHPNGIIDEYRIVCNCRKPGSQMIEFALNHFEILSGEAILFGDSNSDIEAGNRVGVESIIVRPGSIYSAVKERLFFPC